MPSEQRRIVFYSEGSTSWPHLEPIIKELIERGNCVVSYFSSDTADPGFCLFSENYHSFETDEGVFREWLFANIDTEVFVSTTPDIQTFQLKRSKYKVHYIYVQHSLVSLHMAYREHAFSFFDTVFCSARHHIDEIRELEKHLRLPKKNVVKHGYGKLDRLIEGSKKIRNHGSDQLNVLVAPSWGAECIIESKKALEIIRELLAAGFKVTLRPHPETLKSHRSEVTQICDQFLGHTSFVMDLNFADVRSFSESNIMISDWSGSALEYAIGLKKPVLFIDTPYKINNLNYKLINMVPFEVSVRERIGEIYDPESGSLAERVLACQKKSVPCDLEEYIFNVGASGMVGADYILKILSNNQTVNA